jgi:glycosyltransferase involved in cell wall biosynthesis
MTALTPLISPLPRETDVCLIVEGCYPYVAGGVSGWIDWLLRTEPATSFSVVSLWPRPDNQAARYALPPNVVSFRTLYLQDFGATPKKRLRLPECTERLAEVLGTFVMRGGLVSLGQVTTELSRMRAEVPLEVLFNSPIAWELVRRMYLRHMPYGSFLHFFWAWRALLGGLFATLEFVLPQAKVYHTISTGYAGVLAARAALETGRPALLTEHGIYTNERRIELLMAKWVADTIDKGHALDDPRLDLRDIWISAFEAYARTCYEACTEVVTLYKDNQRAQQFLGATPEKLRVIANGIDIGRFEGLARAGPGDRPTIALIGRVVPIKDVKSFIACAKLLRERIADLRAWIIGPTDEQPEYSAQCRALVLSLGLEDCVAFTGAVNILDYLPKIHVAVLSSLSESQPLVVLEAGAAGVPFVATDVGSCREIIEGRSDETPALGPGGFITALVAPQQIADAAERLLRDNELRRQYGDALHERVRRSYSSERAAQSYRDIYRKLAALPARGLEREAM